MKHKVIIEIDGVRHKLIKGRAKNKTGVEFCEKCSIRKMCTKIIDGPCIDLNAYFRKCKPGE